MRKKILLLFLSVLTLMMFSSCDNEKFLNYNYEAEAVAQSVTVTGNIQNIFTDAPVNDALVTLEGQATVTNDNGLFSLNYFTGFDEGLSRPVDVTITADKYYPLETEVVIYPEGTEINEKMVYGAPIVLEATLDSATHYSRAIIRDYQGVENIDSVYAWGWYLAVVYGSNLWRWIPQEMTFVRNIDANTAEYEVYLSREVGLLIYSRMQIYATDQEGFKEQQIFLFE